MEYTQILRFVCRIWNCDVAKSLLNENWQAILGMWSELFRAHFVYMDYYKWRSELISTFFSMTGMLLFCGESPLRRS